MSERSARDAAREQWTANPAGVLHARAAEGTLEFYAQMTETRYRLQPWHPGLLQSFSPRGRLLEIGCGAGTDHAVLAAMVDETVGIDLSQRGVDLTNTRLELEGRPGHAEVADAEDLPFAAESFDAVYSFGVIHHTDHPERVAAEMFRVMRAEGRFMVALYHRWSLFGAAKVLRWVTSGAALRRVPWRQFLATLEFGANVESPPAVRLYSSRSARRLFASFADVQTQTVHTTFRGRHYDQRWARPFGWYVIVTGRKGAPTN